MSLKSEEAFTAYEAGYEKVHKEVKKNESETKQDMCSVLKKKCDTIKTEHL